uniref:PlsC domain-containing protein n=1 Tax=Caenorhabditis japonica TaxID=281687 RepID=A0A8R1HZD6_CAEJA
MDQMLYFAQQAIFLAVGASVVLVASKKSWGFVPNLLVSLLNVLIGERKNENTRIEGEKLLENKQYLTVDFVRKANYTSPLVASLDLCTLGMHAIYQDDLTRPFTLHSSALLDKPRSSNLNPIHVISCLIRYGLLLPLRVCSMLTTLFFLMITSVSCVVLDAEQRTFRYFGITFAKLFNMSTGLIVQHHDKHNRPQFPGVAVSNHISANDVMTIYSGCEYNGRGYTITGQSHGGFVNHLYKYGGKLTPVLLVDRSCEKKRDLMKSTIVEHSRQKDKNCYPVLLFPEGYCSNNTVVLQFRKAIFDGHAPIFPIAMRQNARYGDAFWAEKTYLPYLFRLMTSWATIIDVFYLPPMQKKDDESEGQFAQRVQKVIAEKIGVDALPFDGKLKCQKEQIKYREKLQATLAEILV